MLKGILALLAVTVLSWMLPLLYPLAGAAAAAIAVIGALLAFSARSTSPVTVAGVAALVAFWVVTRREHRLAQAAAYRRARHVVRLVLFAVAAYGYIVLNGGGRPLSSIDSGAPGGSVIATIALHFLLTRATPLRERWHGALELLRLRPKDLEA